MSNVGILGQMQGQMSGHFQLDISLEISNYHMGTKPTQKQSRISTYDAGTYRWWIVSPSIITFLLYFLNVREPLLSNGSRTFKKYIKKVILDGETIGQRSPKPL